jgi:hypothetical protein
MTFALTGEKLLEETQKKESHISISEKLSIQLYSDTRPRIGQIAGLQKGLILVHNGTNLVGEGTGFGVPVARYREKTYFSGSSIIQVFEKNNRTIIAKQFALDMVSQKEFGKAKIGSNLARKIWMGLDDLYMQHKRLRLLQINDLYKSMGFKVNYVKVKPKGTVNVTYSIKPPIIHIKADFSTLEKKNLQRIFVLNEQGARYFRKYSDSNATALCDKKISAWNTVEARWASITNEKGEFGFRLWKVNDTIMHVGRELLEGIFNWVGLDYEVSPTKTSFEYDIEILGSKKQN